MNKSIFLIGVFYSLVLTYAACAESYIESGIPADAIIQGPVPTRDPEVTNALYFLAGKPASPKTLVARDTLRDGKIVSRVLIKNGRWHGLKKDWYPNGVKKSEAPYFNDLRHGRCFMWNERGILVADFRMNMGNGIERIYDEQGILRSEERLTGEKQDGLSFKRREDSLAFGWPKNGASNGIYYIFYLDGTIHTIGWTIHGFPACSIRFDRDGSLLSKSYYINGNKVGDADYARAAASDSTLPPYYPDVGRYKELVGNDTKAIFDRYSSMPRVRMPLQLDEQGLPLPADIKP